LTAPALSDPARAVSASLEPGYDRIACAGCGRMFTTIDGAGMLAAIKGPCPDCGGAFELLGDAPGVPHSR
jgi:hypothetical protein